MSESKYIKYFLNLKGFFEIFKTIYSYNLLSVPVLARSHAGVSLEELVEYGRIREIQFIDDFLDRGISIFQHVLGFEDHEGVDPGRP